MRLRIRGFNIDPKRAAGRRSLEIIVIIELLAILFLAGYFLAKARGLQIIQTFPAGLVGGNNSDKYHSFGSNTKLIVALGDSFTYCLYVPREDCWTTILQKKLGGLNDSNYTVINLGEPGFDALEKVDRFSNWMNDTGGRADLVVFQYLCDDLIPVGTSPRTVEEWFNPSNYTHYRNYLFEENVERAFLKLHGLLNNSKTRVIITFDPSWDTLDCKTFQKEKLAEISRNFSWPFLDSTSVLINYTDAQILSAKDKHPNRLGYEIRASIIFDYLKAHSIIN